MRINKQIFLATLFCPAYGWLSSRKKGAASPDPAEQFKQDQGMEIGKLARTLFPHGILIEEKDMTTAAAVTQKFLDYPEGTCLFEAAFLSEDLAARGDILLKMAGSWTLMEVKSSLRDKSSFIGDMAYTSLAMEMSGCFPEDRILSILSKEYRLGMDRKNLFETIDHTKEVKLRTQEYKKLVPHIQKLLQSDEKPERPFSPLCKNCEFFASCFDFDKGEHIISLPFFSGKLYKSLIAQGCSRIQDIPDTFPLSPHQARMKESLIRKRTVVSDTLEQDLAAIEWPAFYLDFETTMTAIPLFPDVTPYQQIPTQYSIHICSDSGIIQSHREYLADTDRDCRKTLAERLIQDLEGEGSIVVYSGFEKSIIKKLAALFPELAEKLLPLIPRLVDLEKIIKNGIYHPAFQGRSSIKKTLPALVPDMSYDNLPIGNGSAALTAFARMIRGEIPQEKIPQMRKDLLRYCQQDTLAMVKLHEALLQYCTKEEINGIHHHHT